MLRFNFSVCIFVVIYLLNSAFANSTRCYACNGAYCNDPFDTGRANVEFCTNNPRLTDPNTQRFVSNEAISGKKLEEWSSLESKLLGIFFGTNNEFVCVTSSYSNNIHVENMTIRRCMPKSYKNMAPCTYLSSTINSGYGTMLKCATCDTDLCNSGTGLRNSILIVLVVSSLKCLF